MGNLPTGSSVISGGHVTKRGVTNILNFPYSKTFNLLRISQQRDFKYWTNVKIRTIKCEDRYSKTNVDALFFQCIKNQGLYMFRALLALPQEALHKRHLVYCVRGMSVSCTRVKVKRCTVNKILNVKMLYPWLASKAEQETNWQEHNCTQKKHHYFITIYNRYFRKF
jgi:hypothetical protein